MSLWIADDFLGFTSNVNLDFRGCASMWFPAGSDDRSKSDGLIVCGWLLLEFTSAVEESPAVSIGLTASSGGIVRVVTTWVTAFEKNFSSR